MAIIVPSREASLANLHRFIALQQAHLERTRADLDKLDALRDRVKADPEAFLGRLSDELNDPAFRRPSAEYLRLPTIDWSLLAGTDPSTFDNLANSSGQRTLRERNPLREKLDALVLDSGLPPVHRPVYQYIAPARELPGLEETQDDEQEYEEEFVRGEKEAESDEPSSLFGTPEPPGAGVRFSLPGTANGHGPWGGVKVEDDSPEPDGAPSSGRKHSTTFNQQWSTVEQRLLEKYLALIAPSTTQRWAKVSKAMKQGGADRTPRQVASRVQKMIAKMVKMGVRPDVRLFGVEGETAEGEKKRKKGDGGVKGEEVEEDTRDVKRVKVNVKAKPKAPRR